jgi:hypothetical protein
LDFLRKNRRSYLALSELIGGMTVIAAMPIDVVKTAILERALKDLRFEPILKEEREIGV